MNMIALWQWYWKFKPSPSISGLATRYFRRPSLKSAITLSASSSSCEPYTALHSGIALQSASRSASKSCHKRKWSSLFSGRLIISTTRAIFSCMLSRRSLAASARPRAASRNIFTCPSRSAPAVELSTLTTSSCTRNSGNSYPVSG